jgi:hypothetical protein
MRTWPWCENKKVKNPLGRPGSSWEDNIKTDLKNDREACGFDSTGSG